MAFFNLKEFLLHDSLILVKNYISHVYTIVHDYLFLDYRLEPGLHEH